MSQATNTTELPQNIVLIGFMGSGKSTVGRMLAHRLRFRFLDTDRLVEQREQARISEIFEKHGEARFRECETAALESLREKRNHVFATGGGIVTVPRNIPLLRSLGLVVLLTAEPDEIFRRVSGNSKRPLLQVEDPRSRVRELMSLRMPLYENTAHFRVDGTRLSHGEVAARIADEAHRVFGQPARATP